MVETYLRERDTLRLVVLILDVRRDPSEEDLQLIYWLPFYQIPFRIVLTKTDKVSNNEFADRRRRIVERVGFPPETPLVAFSAKTGAGKELLWREIRKAVESDTGLKI
jgi:GTP-binding protein